MVPSWQGWSAALALGIACTGVAYAIFFRLLQRIGPTQAMTVTYLIPVFGVIWGALFLFEPISANMVLGGVIILFGLWIVT
jgi:drug/metabolite transporter (DMT)-like permease